MGNKLKIFGFVICMGIYKSSFAVPLFIYFNEMINRTSCIATGTFLGYNGKTPDQSSIYYFKVDQYLKTPENKPASDTLELSRASGSVYLQPGTKCVAFINEKGGFEWYGTTKNATITDPSILYIEGFYDFNAYIVSPCMLSVGQLKDYLKEGNYSGSVYGDVHFFSNATKQMESSIINIEVKYTYTGDHTSHHNQDRSIDYTVLVNGIQLNDFKNKPAFGLPWHYEEVVLEYQPDLYRPLEIKGKIKELHPGYNRWHCYFWVEEPKELTYDEFAEFIKDPQKGHPYYELEVKMDNDKTYQVIIHDEIGRMGKLIGYDKDPIPISSLSTSPAREIVFEYDKNNIILTLDSTLVDKSAFEFASDDLIRELKINQVKGLVSLQSKDKLFYTPVGRCTVSYKATRFAKYQ